MSRGNFYTIWTVYEPFLNHPSISGCDLSLLPNYAFGTPSKYVLYKICVWGSHKSLSYVNSDFMTECKLNKRDTKSLSKRTCASLCAKYYKYIIINRVQTKQKRYKIDDKDPCRFHIVHCASVSKMCKRSAGSWADSSTSPGQHEQATLAWSWPENKNI